MFIKHFVHILFLMVRGLCVETSRDEFIRVIESVKKRPELYHRRASERGHEARLRIWSQVGRETSLPAMTCKERWRYARSVFVRYSRKENVGKAGEELVAHLQFLKPHISFKKEPIATKYTIKLSDERKIISNRSRTLLGFNKQDKTKDTVKKKLTKIKHPIEQDSNQYVDTFTKLQNLRKKTILNVAKLEENSASEMDFLDEEPVLEFVFDKHVQIIREYCSEDSDLNFLKSLLHEVKLMNVQQKELFKSKMIHLAVDAVKKSNVTRHTI